MDSRKMKMHNEINVRPLPDGRWWELKDWVAFEIEEGKVIFIPKKFLSDFASIPRLLWLIIGAPATGKYRRAALFHDWLHRTQTVTFKEALDIMYIIMTFDQVNWFKKRLIYTGVFAGGIFAWKSVKDQEKETWLRMQKEQFDEKFDTNLYSVFA